VNVGDFRELVVRPALKHLAEGAFRPNLWSKVAEDLVVGTAAHESGGLVYLWQRNAKGNRLGHLQAGRGLFQIQPGTHRDIWMTYLNSRPPLRSTLVDLSTAQEYELLGNGRPSDDELVWNLRYAAAVCRLIYWRRPEKLPEAGDVEGMADYWGEHYQTSSDPEKIARWINDYNQYVRG